jgi:hypothetical protein
MASPFLPSPTPHHRAGHTHSGSKQRPTFEVADILRAHLPDSLHEHSHPLHVHKVLSAIQRQKTEKGHPLYLPTLPARNAWLASSDIIESVVGHDQAFTTRGLLEEVGKLVLLIPAFLSDLTAPVIREAMESVRTIDVEQWVDAHLGISMQCCRHFLLVRV